MITDLPGWSVSLHDSSNASRADPPRTIALRTADLRTAISSTTPGPTLTPCVLPSGRAPGLLPALTIPGTSRLPDAEGRMADVKTLGFCHLPSAICHAGCVFSAACC